MMGLDFMFNNPRGGFGVWEPTQASGYWGDQLEELLRRSSPWDESLAPSPNAGMAAPNHRAQRAVIEDDYIRQQVMDMNKQEAKAMKRQDIVDALGMFESGLTKIGEGAGMLGQYGIKDIKMPGAPYKGQHIGPYMRPHQNLMELMMAIAARRGR